MVHPSAGQDDGSDHLLVVNGHRVGFFTSFWRGALEVAPISLGEASEDWRDVEILHVSLRPFDVGVRARSVVCAT